VKSEVVCECEKKKFLTFLGRKKKEEEKELSNGATGFLSQVHSLLPLVYLDKDIDWSALTMIKIGVLYGS
jgi:hypothetical protein